MKKNRIILWGTGHVGSAVIRTALHRDDIRVVAARVFSAEKNGRDIGELAGMTALGVKATTSTEAILATAADCVIFAPAASQAPEERENDLATLLKAGKNVITTVTLSAEATARLQTLASQSGATLHCTGIHPGFMVERLVLTLARALTDVDHIRFVEALDLNQAPAGMWGDLAALGFGQKRKQTKAVKALADVRYGNVIASVARALYGAAPADIRIEQELHALPADADFTAGGLDIKKDSTAALHIVHKGYIGDHHFFTNEECWYLGKAWRGEALPFGNFSEAVSYSIELKGGLTKLSSQLEFEPVTASNPWLAVAVQAVMDAIAPVSAAAPGLLLNDATPRYQSDGRLSGNPGANTPVNTAPKKKKYKVIIWGPGEIGGAVVRAALNRPDIEIVGAKVFSPHKHGRDLGELVGVAPIGVKATRSKAEILAMNADCVIVTPMPRSIIEGLDNDVIEILESGKNVVTSAAYHNVTMPNWFASAQSPTALLHELSHTHGIAQSNKEEMALRANKVVMDLVHSRWLKPFVPAVLDKVLNPVMNKVLPLRATPQRLQAACRQGGVSLHGTGVHPTFMAERVGITMASALEEVQHMRFIEAVDFSFAPDGMWGGLQTLGFGLPLDQLNNDFLIAKAGDFYYGDVIGNAAHLLYGARTEDVSVERSFRGIAADSDFHVGSTLIKKGHAAALHMVHKGFIGDHHFFTNEECWYLGPDKIYRGDNLPFRNFKTPISYTVDIRGKPSRLKAQFSLDGNGPESEWLTAAANNTTASQRSANGQKARKDGITNPITNVTAMAILDAVGPVCAAAPGVVIDDIRPGYRIDNQRNQDLHSTETV